MTLTYEQAAERYRTGKKNAEGHVKLAHATFLVPLYTDDPAANRLLRVAEFAAFAIRYHATDVVTLHIDGSYTLTSGGWWTRMTRARMEEYAPVRIAQVKNLWYIRPYSLPSTDYIFFDGIRVDHRGKPLGKTLDMAYTVAAARTLDRDVSRYIKGFAADVAANGLADPSGGDCWGCAMRPVITDPAAPHAGAEALGLGHYQDHFDEGYYVPSLLWNAIREAGYRDPGLIWHMIQSDAKRGDSRYSMLPGILRAFFRRRKPAILGLTATVPVRTPLTLGQAIGASR